MADFIGRTRTNYFRVTDEERYSEIFGKLSGDVQDFTEEAEGDLLHGFGSWGPIDYFDEDCDDGGLDGFLSALQPILPEDEAFICFLVGGEKLRYLEGLAIVCTRDEVSYLDLDSWARRKAKKLLGEDFKTRTTY